MWRRGDPPECIGYFQRKRRPKRGRRGLQGYCWQYRGRSLQPQPPHVHTHIKGRVGRGAQQTEKSAFPPYLMITEDMSGFGLCVVERDLSYTIHQKGCLLYSSAHTLCLFPGSSGRISGCCLSLSPPAQPRPQATYGEREREQWVPLHNLFPVAPARPPERGSAPVASPTRKWA